MKTLHWLYHEIRPLRSAYRYATVEEDFRQQITLFAAVRAGQGASVLPAITFDDGYRSDVERALPLLQRHGLHARFFITAGWTGQRIAYMDGAQLRELHAAGQALGAHGWSHKLLTHCTDAELQQELGGARAALEDCLGAEVRTMSRPGGRADARVLRRCAEAGYTQVFTSVPRAENMQTAPVRVGRVNVHGDAALSWFERVLDPSTGALDSMERKERWKSWARQLLGDRAYASLWARLNRQSAEDAQAEAAGA